MSMFQWHFQWRVKIPEKRVFFQELGRKGLFLMNQAPKKKEPDLGIVVDTHLMISVGTFRVLHALYLNQTC